MATAIQFLRSSIPGLRPDPDSLTDGMPMVNLHESEPGLFLKLSDNSIAKFGPTHVGNAAPNSSPALTIGNSVGEMWLDTTLPTAILKVWSDSGWVPSGTDLSGILPNQVLFADSDGAIIGDEGLKYDERQNLFSVSGNATFGSSSTNRFEVEGEARFSSQVKVGGTLLNPNIRLEPNGN